MSVYKSFGDPFQQRFFYPSVQQKDNSKLVSSFTDLSKYDNFATYNNNIEQEQKPKLAFSSILSFSSRDLLKDKILDRPPGLEEEKQNVEKFPKNKYLTNLEALDEVTNKIEPKNQNYQPPSVLDLVQDKFEKNNFESYIKEVNGEQSFLGNSLNQVPHDILNKILNVNNINADNLGDLKTLGRSTLATLHQKLSSILGIKINFTIKINTYLI